MDPTTTSIYPTNAVLRVINNSGSSDVTLSFPCLQDTLDMARSASYQIVELYNNPNGLHIYKSTSPMLVKFSFELDINDERLVSPIDLFKYSAILHSLTLPQNSSGNSDLISTNSLLSSNGDLLRQGSAGELTIKDGKLDNDAMKNSSSLNDSSIGVSVVPPPVCSINFSNAGEYGINLVGYVKDVATSFKAPWINIEGCTNAPSRLEASFNFMVVPFMNTPHDTRIDGNDVAYNTYTSSTLLHGDILKKFYNIFVAKRTDVTNYPENVATDSEQTVNLTSGNEGSSNTGNEFSEGLPTADGPANQNEDEALITPRASASLRPDIVQVDSSNIDQTVDYLKSLGIPVEVTKGTNEQLVSFQ